MENLLFVDPPISQVYRPLSDSSLTFDLPALIDTMKHNHTRAHGEPNSIILLKSPEKQIILTALNEGTEVKFFPSNDSITFQVIEGKIKILTRNESVTLYKGHFLTFHTNMTIILISKEETVFMLTIESSSLRQSIN
jgi:hypothetical protein